jgi:hypothetical protein
MAFQLLGILPGLSLSNPKEGKGTMKKSPMILIILAAKIPGFM